jgi:23S rRNA pseudouridine2605 synthase
MDNKLDSGERIAKVISRSGFCSRRMAETIILQNRVKVNQKVISTPATFVNDADIITIDDKTLPRSLQRRVWLYNKPVGFVTTHKDPQGRLTVFDELKTMGLPHVISVGRLDLNSEGLLILTNDPSFAYEMESPKNCLARTYKVRVFGAFNYDDFKDLRNGITIDGIHYKPIYVKILSESGAKNQWLEVTINEGKNREIRKIMEYFDLKVNRLIRVSFGRYTLGNLQPGQIIEIDPNLGD